MFRTSHIRTKLALALAVPMAALVGLAGYQVVDARSQVGDAEAQSSLADASVGPGSLVVNLQNERNRAAIDLIGLGDAADLAVDTTAEARDLTNPSIEAFRNETGSRGEAVAAAFAPAWTALEDLEAIRADIDAYDGPLDSSNHELADQVFQRYTTIIEAFFDGTSQVVQSVDDGDLRNGAEIVDAATRQSEMRARIVRDVVVATILGTLDERAVRQDVAALFARSRAFDEAIQVNATGPYAGVADATFAEAAVQSFNEQVSTFLADGGVDITRLLASVAAGDDIGYTGLRARAAALLASEADSLTSDAQLREKVFAGVALAGLLLALLVTWLASRSITRPLRSLREQAEEMAGRRLPAAVRQILDTPPGEDVVIPKVQPIKVPTKDEVSQVAAALSRVQSSAVDLAVEQAVLRRNISDSYINLGRRNQNLLSRQIDFITELERNETDPDTLEGLFRLDHLATRMRRNAESLLVLAGIEPPRQWAAPMKVADVVRAALSEVEDYQRVVVRHLEPAAITGAVAADVAHVLAELIENALSFSPPEQSVEVKGRLTTTGYTVAIADNGLGMTADEVIRANRRLAGLESFTVAPSRYLGHYVAGHLASRMGLGVELQDSPAGGITAKVDLPMGLLIDDELNRSLARPPAAPKPEPAPVVAGPAAATVAGTTANGLAKRGDRNAAPADEEQPVSEPVPAEAPSSGPEEAPPAPSTPRPTLPMRRRTDQPVAEPPASVPAASPTPAADPEPAPAPLTSPLEAVGGVNGGNLALTQPPGPSMYSVAAKLTRPESNGHATPVGEATPSGLTRRVPGAQRPDAPMSARPPEEPEAEPSRTTPEDVYSFLSSFQSGVARGRADAASDTPTPNPEDQR